MKSRNRTEDLSDGLKFLVFSVLILLSAMAVTAQSTRPDIFYLVELSQQTREQVVKIILASYFKPGGKPKVIYLAEEGLQKHWLPVIKNIEFRLLSTDEIERKKIKVYLFSEVWQNTPGLYKVVFGYGDPTCQYLGDLWNFREVNFKVKLWRKRDDQIEGDCSHPS